MTILFLALWLQMSAPPQIQLHCVTEFGCEHSERWGDGGEFSSLFYTQGIASTNGVLSWTSAETPHDKPWKNCVVSDAAGNDKPCGAADETDGLHECKDEADSNCLQAKCCGEKVKGADETDGKPPKGPLTTKHNHIERGEFVDPVDVPAVQEPQLPDLKWCGDHMKTDAGYSICVLHIAQNPPITTCADKSRILEHDENSPPKYWCRKVEF